MPQALTMMAVHAHPDDEVIPTGGVLRRYGDEGITTVVVTCTDGRHGFDEGFVNPDDPSHDADSVAAVRAGELERSCAALGVGHLELLGYGDSGMRGWETNHHDRSFCNADLEEATGRLVELIDHYRPQVVVTYDERDGHGHPDHVRAYEITAAAVAQRPEVAKFYLCVRSAALAERIERSRAAIGFESSRPSSGQAPRPRRPDTEITTVVDTRRVALAKLAALECHFSQLSGSHWLAHPPSAIEEIFCEETFIRLLDRTGAPLPEDDLFAGLR
jgi:LmbE family N-acetylglucosaminyl deacetylase